MELYRNPANMEPMMPQGDMRALEELSCVLLQKIGGLKEKLHPTTSAAVAEIVSEMNSYYSNLIEGNKTLPQDIEKARRERLNIPFDDMGVAVAEAEKRVLSETPEADVLSKEFILKIHRELYSQIPASMRMSKTVSGTAYEIIPGQLRNFEVSVGRHTPPYSKDLDMFLDRFREAYSDIAPSLRLVAVAASHHRLAWIHPFGDGNGRVVRIFSNALMMKWNLDGNMIWSTSRGLARRHKSYYEYLSLADAGRANAFDGRGNLSNRGLSDFCKFYLETMLDQMDFMLQLLKFENVFLHYAEILKDDFKKQWEYAYRLLKEIWDRGELPRGKASEVTGLKERSSREILSMLENGGYIVSNSPKTPVRINVSVRISERIFPNLYLPVQTQ